MKQKYLVVYEDLWHNKESFKTNKIGDTIKQILKDYDIKTEDELDYEKYNSKKPYDIGTMGLGFYDITLFDEEDEYAGRIMIFEI